MRNVSELFATQDGLATVDQIRVAGVGDRQRDVRLRSGEWERFDRDVIGVAGAPVTWHRQVRSALLTVGPHAVVSHVTAARLHRFDGFAAEPAIHVSVPGLTHHSVLPGFVAHRSRVLTAVERVEVDGLPVVPIPIALVHVAAMCGRDACRQALDGVLRDGASSVWLERAITRWRRRGVSGPATVLELIAETEGRIPRSWFQRLAARVLRATGVRFVDEHPVTDPSTGRKLADLDLACPELRIGVECQSWRWHSTPSARAADARRKRRLRRLGWDIVELWWSDLDRPDEVLADIRFLIDRRPP